jgi:threonine aldolase
MKFASDNTSGVCPEVLAAIAAESARYGPAYGDDRRSSELVDTLSEVFERPVGVYPVATGTAANSLSLTALNPPWGGVICHQEAHIAVDELAAPSAIGGGLTLLPLAGDHGKLTPEVVDDAFVRRENGVHTVPITGLSITQVTETGTCYGVDELVALAEVATRRGLRIHMDGARFANAVVATGASPAELTWRHGVDLLSFGATKGGALAAEAIVSFDPSLDELIQRHRKRFGHLLSKQRLAAAQILGWVTDGVWLRHAAHANRLAARLGAGLDAAGMALSGPVEANMAFVRMTDDQAAALRSAGASFYTQVVDPGLAEARFVTSWSSSESEVDDLIRSAGQIIAA